MQKEKIKEIVDEVVTNLGYELYKFEILQGGGRTIVRVFIDKPFGFVSISDCTKISRALEGKLDRFFESRWILEVSSAAIDREINSPEDAKKYVEKFRGMEIEVVRKDGTVVEGIAMDVVEDEVFLKKEKVLWKDKKKVKIERIKVQDIEKMRLKVKF